MKYSIQNIKHNEDIMNLISGFILMQDIKIYLQHARYQTQRKHYEGDIRMTHNIQNIKHNEDIKFQKTKSLTSQQSPKQQQQQNPSSKLNYNSFHNYNETPSSVALSTVFHSMNFPDYSPLSHSVFPVLFLL